MGELRTLIGILDAQSQQASVADLQEYFNKLSMARLLMKMALEDKLDQRSPVKEQMEMERVQILAQAEINLLSNPSNIDTNELEAYYNTNKARYQTVKLDAIYIAFTLSDEPQPAGEPKLLTKAQARAKAEKLLEQIKAGADFAKLVRENSDDDQSKAKGGDFGTFSPADTNIPDIVRNAVFRLKTGEATNIIEQPAGFYIFRAAEVRFKPFSEVRDQVYTEYKQQIFAQLFEDLRKKSKAMVAPELLKKDEAPKK